LDSFQNSPNIFEPAASWYEKMPPEFVLRRPKTISVFLTRSTPQHFGDDEDQKRAAQAASE
jgi:hypothetical protein